MTILTPKIVLDETEFLRAQGRNLRLEQTREIARLQLGVAARLTSPAVVYEWLPVDRLDAKQARVGGVMFHLGAHAGLLTAARQVLVAVVTIGPSLEDRCRSLGESGDPLRQFLLHEAGTFAVAKAVEAAHPVAEARAAASGWGVGPELAPGQLAGWTTSEQLLFGELLDLDSIGVRLTETGMLVPQKSASLLIGVGPDYPSAKVHAPCGYCDLARSCGHRHQRIGLSTSLDERTTL